MLDINVKHSGLIDRTIVSEAKRGTLFAVDEKQLPFEMVRIYAIFDIPSGDVARGGHAHKKSDQVYFVMRGSCTLHLDDGETTQDLVVTNADPGVRLGPMLWHTMSDFSSDCIVLVAASEEYDESDYIRNYDEYTQHRDRTV